MHKTKRVAVVLTALMASACAMRVQTKPTNTMKPLVETSLNLEPVQTKRTVQKRSEKKQISKKPQKRNVGEILADLKDNNTRFNAMYELGELDFSSMDEKYLDKVKRDVLDTIKFDSEVLAPGIAVLGKLADPYLVSELAKYSLNRNDNVRRQVAKALGNMPTDDSILILIDLIGDRRPTVERAAIDSLAKIGSSSSRHLVAVVANGNMDRQYAAVEALSMIGSDAIPHVAVLLGHPDNKVVYHAVTVLGNIGDKSATAALHDALYHSDNNVRGTAANALRKIGDQSSIDALMPIAKNDSSDFVRAAAKYAIDALSQ